MSRDPQFVSGFVTLLGRPNAGKSTLLNSLVGSKVAIVSDKPQTTRQAIQGVVNLDGAQVIFVDTPGIHDGGLLIHKRMMDAVRRALEERDLLLWLADATLGFEPAEAEALEMLAGSEPPVFLVLNKIDRLKEKQRLLPLIDAYRQRVEFRECIPISALTGDGVEELKAQIVRVLPEGPQYFPPDFVTDQPERYLAAELIREKILHVTRQEVPHSVAVLVEQWEENEKLLRIAAAVYVERDGHKRIIIGSRGAVLKSIGMAARQEMEPLFGRRIFLELFVKVRPQWRQNPEFLNEIDWRYMAGGRIE